MGRRAARSPRRRSPDAATLSEATMTITHDTMTVESVLQAVRLLSPSILDRAGEIETGRRVPPDLIDDLRTAGCFRLVRPATHGGLEASIPDAMRALESLAR